MISLPDHFSGSSEWSIQMERALRRLIHTCRFIALIVTICLHLGAALSVDLVISLLNRVLGIIDLSFACSEAICAVLYKV